MSRAVPVLETKFYIPKWPAGHVTRARLIDRIREGVQRKLTVVSAPAGSGKTTVLAEWLAQRPGDDPPVGWVSLDAADNEPAVFWTCIIRALQKIDSDVGQQALAAIQADAAPSAAVLTSLLNEIAAIDREFILVLDDYHLIQTPSIHTALAHLLDHLPPRMHVVIATRADPLLPLARMRAREELTELRAADLRFTSEETSAFLNRVMALGLPTTDIAALETRTEGWIAGLKLAALSMKNHQDVHAFVRSFSGDNRFVADYLVDEVLQAQPERTRRFLLMTSVLQRLSAPLCDAVTGERGSQSLLDTLEKTNLFVIALDDRRQWYRYHHLFAEVLEAHATREDSDLVRTMHLRASAWYEENGFTSDAVQHAVRANDVERVAELLERNWPAMDRTYQSSRWLTRVRALPESIVKARPVLNTAYAWALLNAGELEAAAARIDEVEASLAASSNVVSDHARFQTLPREVATARLYLAQSRGDFAGTIEHASQALGFVPEHDHAGRVTPTALMALGQWAHGDLEAAHVTFGAALAHMRAAGLMQDVIRGMFVLGDIRAAQGRLRDAERAYEAGLELAAAQGATGVAETDELYLGLTELHIERGDRSKAEQLLRTIDESPARSAHSGNRHRWCEAMSRIAVAQGDLDRAFDFLTTAEAQLRRDPLPQVRSYAAMKTRIWIAQGKLVEAVRWATEHGLRADDELSFLREYSHVTLARLFIAQNKLEDASRLLHRLTIAARTGGRVGSVIETLALQALAQQKAGNQRAALDAIAEALTLAEPEGYLRVFVDEGMPMRDLLRLATARGIAGGYTRHVLAAFEPAAQPAPAPPVNGAEAARGQLLTARELEILRLIAAGMRNQEIADQLFISTATVKRHIANVYNKLDARHRTEALKRAGALNLL